MRDVAALQPGGTTQQSDKAALHWPTQDLFPATQKGEPLWQQYKLPLGVPF